MTKEIYIEGASSGPDSKAMQARCREGFHKLLDRAGFKGRKPKLVASGTRRAAFDDFCRAQKQAKAGDYIALLVDSEDPVADIERPWVHLQKRDKWKPPASAIDEQVLLMTTCMETWIAADPQALKSTFGNGFQDSALPPAQGLEQRDRRAIQDALDQATRRCKSPYKKGERSFQVLATLDPKTLAARLPSFARAIRILEDRL